MRACANLRSFLGIGSGYNVLIRRWAVNKIFEAAPFEYNTYVEEVSNCLSFYCERKRRFMKMKMDQLLKLTPIWTAQVCRSTFLVLS